MCKDLTETKNLPAQYTPKIIAYRDDMDVRMFAHVLSKDMGMGKFSSLSEIAYEFYKDVQTLVGEKHMPPLPKGWKPKGKTSVHAEPKQGFKRSCTEISVSGPSKEQVVADLRTRGVVIGAGAVCKKDQKQVYTITAISKDAVSLQSDTDDETSIRVKVATILTDYTVKARVEEDHGGHNCTSMLRSTSPFC